MLYRERVSILETVKKSSSCLCSCLRRVRVRGIPWNGSGFYPCLTAPFLEGLGVQFSCRRGNIIRKIGMAKRLRMKRGFCSFRQRVSLFLSTASRVHGPHSFQAQSHPKAHSSLCPQMQKPAGDHQKGKPSSRDVNQAEWPLAMARAPIWSRNTALPRSPSIVPYVTHRPRFLYYRRPG